MDEVFRAEATAAAELGESRGAERAGDVRADLARAHWPGANSNAIKARRRDTGKTPGKPGAGRLRGAIAVAVADTQEHAVTVENDLYRVVFSNRGAVVKSWELKKYMDDSKPQKVLNVVHPEAAQADGRLAVCADSDDPQLQAAGKRWAVSGEAIASSGAKSAEAIRSFRGAMGTSKSRRNFTSTIRTWCMSILS